MRCGFRDCCDRNRHDCRYCRQDGFGSVKIGRAKMPLFALSESERKKLIPVIFPDEGNNTSGNRSEEQCELAAKTF
jgi:hypothetical protein